jgi:hypothetical protein
MKEVRAFAASSAPASEEVRAGLSPVGERQAAPDRSRRPTVGSRRDRLRADGVPAGLTPLPLVVTRPSTELGQRRSPRHVVVGFPAVHGLEHLPGESRDHVETMAPRRRAIRPATRSRRRRQMMCPPGDLLAHAPPLVLVELAQGHCDRSGGAHQEVPVVVCVREAPRDCDLVDLGLREAGCSEQAAETNGVPEGEDSRSVHLRRGVTSASELGCVHSLAANATVVTRAPFWLRGSPNGGRRAHGRFRYSVPKQQVLRSLPKGGETVFRWNTRVMSAAVAVAAFVSLVVGSGADWRWS